MVQTVNETSTECDGRKNRRRSQHALEKGVSARAWVRTKEGSVTLAAVLNAAVCNLLLCHILQAVILYHLSTTMQHRTYVIHRGEGIQERNEIVQLAIIFIIKP